MVTYMTIVIIGCVDLVYFHSWLVFHGRHGEALGLQWKLLVSTRATNMLHVITTPSPMQYDSAFRYGKHLAEAPMA
jgi:hypothetical protein